MFPTRLFPIRAFAIRVYPRGSGATSILAADNRDIDGITSNQRAASGNEAGTTTTGGVSSRNRSIVGVVGGIAIAGKTRSVGVAGRGPN